MSSETGLNLDWKKSQPKVVWQVPGGAAFSSLAIVEGKVVTGCERGKADGVLCLEAASGKELWFREVGPAYVDKQRQGAGPRATPTVAGGVVYASMATGELAALKLADGSELWKVNIVTLAGVKDRAGEQFYWGQSASPLVEGDLVIVQPGGTNGRSVLALDKNTGKIVWQVGDDVMGYASPIAIDLGKRRLLIVPTGQAVLGLDPVKGELLFRQPFGNQFGATCSTPVWTGEVLLLSAAYGGGTLALELSPNGDKIDVKEKWKSRDLMSLMAPLIVRNGQLLAFHGDLSRFGIRSLDVATGNLLWTHNLPGRLCFVWAEDHLFGVTEQGTIQLIKPGEKGVSIEGEITDLLKGRVWAMPALVGKRLYLRDARTILCLDVASR
jgi:outer membrane protein assembly factor BamB